MDSTRQGWLRKLTSSLNSNHQLPSNLRIYHCLFSPDPQERQFQGVSIFANRSCFWQVVPIKWSRSDLCYQYWQDCWLCAVQTWYGHGGTSLLIYNAYFPSGSRWDKGKRRYFHIETITTDHIVRGQIPAIILGDFNMTWDEDTHFRNLIHNKTWYNLAAIGNNEEQQIPNCHVGSNNGSLIDFILTDVTLVDQFRNYQVRCVNLVTLRTIRCCKFLSISLILCRVALVYVIPSKYPS